MTTPLRHRTYSVVLDGECLLAYVDLVGSRQVTWYPLFADGNIDWDSCHTESLDDWGTREAVLLSYTERLEARSHDGDTLSARPATTGQRARQTVADTSTGNLFGGSA